MKKIVPFLLLITILFFSAATLRPTSCYACSCAFPKTPDEAFDRSHTVFTGKVLDVKQKYASSENYGAGTIAYRNLVLFEVMDSYKGVAQTQIIIDAGFGEDSCGYDYTLGEAYLVYASNVGTNTLELKTGYCSGTKELAIDDNDIQQLHKESLPLKHVDLSAQMASSPFDDILYFGNRYLHKLLQPSLLLFNSIALVCLALLSLVALVTRHKFPYHRIGVYLGAAAGLWNMALFVQLTFFSTYPKEAYMYIVAILVLIFLPACLAVAASLLKFRSLFLVATIGSLPGLYITSVFGMARWFAAGVFCYVLAAIWMSMRGHGKSNTKTL
ncbi:hypothetical protein [Paenibacillus sp. RC67]|uniref:hypothetical protein n=1 Tax=Paenibacillus sp. RC67 TaxID=3039392 RepID=UPI0024ACAFBE|nr:hypothetical protein [Paenibacillus sp. RC67]